MTFTDFQHINNKTNINYKNFLVKSSSKENMCFKLKHCFGKFRINNLNIFFKYKLSS